MIKIWEKVAENKLLLVFWRDRTKGANVVFGCTKYGKLAEREVSSMFFSYILYISNGLSLLRM